MFNPIEYQNLHISGYQATYQRLLQESRVPCVHANEHYFERVALALKITKYSNHYKLRKGKEAFQFLSNRAFDHPSCVV